MVMIRRVWVLLLVLLLVGVPYSRAQIRRKRPRIEDDLRGTSRPYARTGLPHAALVDKHHIHPALARFDSTVTGADRSRLTPAKP